MENYREYLIEKRRQYHRIPEAGFLEMQTTSEIIKELKKLGYKNIRYGKAIHHRRLGVPHEEAIAAHLKSIKLKADFDTKEIEKGYTGLIAEYDSGISGPKFGFRFDIDGLALEESKDEDHIPNKLGFSSQHDNFMHACGHDGHIAMGLALAKYVISNKNLKGSYRFIFQGAEEGVRGGKSMTDAGCVDHLDYLFSSHLGMGLKSGEIGLGSVGFFATKKFDIDLTGRSSHASKAPEEGRSALLAAASLSLILNNLTQYSKGMARVNVGVLKSGTERNIVPQSAHMELEIRAEQQSVLNDMESRLMKALEGTSVAFEVENKIEEVGSSIAYNYVDEKFLEDLKIHLDPLKYDLILKPKFGASEDVSYMLKQVSESGGKSLHFIIGSDLKAKHHMNSFDFDENSLLTGFQLYRDVIEYLNGKKD
ncbi:MAG: amidohydrolase [Peptoniphilus sp.]|nr:amidohydrolase [Peptoniphilus sp.]